MSHEPTKPERGIRPEPELGPWGRDDLMALAAVRYCLGRQTYIVGDCAQWLPLYWHKFEQSTRETILRDLEREIRRDDEARARGDRYPPLGMDYDRAEWVKLRDTLKAMG